METLTHLLSGNPTNASLFRECGGARCAHNLVPYMECRHQVLAVVRELVLTCGGDDDMGTLLGMMHSAPASQILFKFHILQVNPIVNLFFFLMFFLSIIVMG